MYVNLQERIINLLYILERSLWYLFCIHEVSRNKCKILQAMM